MMKVFVSSTFVDLAEYRKAVIDALERLGTQVGKMEVFGARPEGAEEACLKEVEDSDIFIGIYAHRYGYVPQNSQISITEQELEHAVHHGKRIFCFLVDENYPWPPKMIEDEPAAKSKLQSLIARIKPAYVVDTFTTQENLAVRVSTSVARYLGELQQTVSREIKTKLEVRAPAKRIWEIVTNVDLLPVWVPKLGRCEGMFRQGAYLETKDRFLNLIPSQLYLLKVEPEHEIRLIRYPPVLPPQWFKREYVLSMMAIDESSVCITCKEIFQGELMRFLKIFFWGGEIVRRRTLRIERHLMKIDAYQRRLQ